MSDYSVQTHEAGSGLAEYSVHAPAYIHGRRCRGTGELVQLAFPFASPGRHLRLTKVIEEPTPIGGKPAKAPAKRKKAAPKPKPDEAGDPFAATVPTED